MSDDGDTTRKKRPAISEEIAGLFLQLSYGVRAPPESAKIVRLNRGRLDRLLQRPARFLRGLLDFPLLFTGGGEFDGVFCGGAAAIYDVDHQDQNDEHQTDRDEMRQLQSAAQVRDLRAETSDLLARAVLRLRDRLQRGGAALG